MKRAVLEEAEALMTEFGDEAYSKAREAMREAGRRHNRKLERFFSKVALEIARQTNREVGLDTATRWLSGAAK